MFLKENMRLINSFLIYTLTFCGAFKDLLAEPETCSIQSIFNGAIGKYVRKSRWSSSTVFKEIEVGTIVEENEDLYIRCHEGFEVLGSHKQETRITCSKGRWSSALGCKPGSCTVPLVENGKMERHIVRYISRSRDDKIYFPLVTGEYVDHNTTLVLRCNKNFSIVESGEILNDELGDVTCNDGTWSRDLNCKRTFCMGDPPKMENGTAVVRSRKHGHRLRYKCDNLKEIKKIPGNVTCHFGTWIGIPPECDSLNDCQIPKIPHGSLNDRIVGDYYFDIRKFRYERIIQNVSVSVGNTVPSAKVLFLICENSYTFQGTNQPAVEVQCLRGRWNPDPMCLHRGHPYIPTTTVKPRLSRKTTISLPLVTSSHGRYGPSETAATQEFSLSTTPSTVSTSLATEEVTTTSVLTDPKTENLEDQCSCHYPIDDRSVVAHANGKILNLGDIVQNGATVIFRCLYVGYHQLIGPSEITCTNCQPWHSSDFPSCAEPKKGNVVIIFDETVKVLENGTVEITKGQNVNFICNAMETAEYPKWDVPDAERISFRSESKERKHFNDILYRTHLSIQDADYSHEGKYHCYIKNYEKTTLNVAVIGAGEPICRLPRKPVDSQLKLSPEKNVYIFGEKLVFSCPPGMKLDSELEVIMCLARGWSHNLLPECIRDEMNEDIQEPCEIPSILNGAFGKFRRESNRSLSTVFKEVPVGSYVPADYKFLLKCNGSFLFQGKVTHSRYTPTECSEGRLRPEPVCANDWCFVKDLQYLLHVSPATQSETPSNEYLNLICDEGYSASPDLPFCDKGKWNHVNQTLCIKTSCYVKDLQYLLHVSPATEPVTPSNEYLNLICDEGYSASPDLPFCAEGKWNHANQTLCKKRKFSGCVLERSSFSNLHIEPEKPSYQLGESISLSCPLYEELIPKIERIVCLGNGWSDIVPKCEEIDYF